MPRKLPPVVFIAFGVPSDNSAAALPSLRAEEANISEALRDIRALGSWEVNSGLQCTRSQIVQQFNSDRVAILHFGGHSNRTSLFLPAEQPGAQEVSGDDLDQFLERQKNLKLAFFNACSNQHWSDKLSTYVPYVVATQCPVPDKMGMDFASAFYERLAADRPVEEAFDHACRAVTLQHQELGIKVTRDIDEADEDTSEAPKFPWVLCKNKDLTEEERSWTLSIGAHDPLIGLPLLNPNAYVLPDRPYVTIKGHTEADAQIFFGRNAEIRRLYDWAVSDSVAGPVLLFYGQSGAGKSSLITAGLLPRLRMCREVVYRRRNTTLIEELESAIGGASETAIRAWLSAKQPQVIILDQVEEAITHSNGSAEEMLEFIARVKQVFALRAPGSAARLVLSFRKEYLAEMLGMLAKDVPEGAPDLVEHFWLDRLDCDGIVEVVEGPVRRADLQAKYKISLEDGFADFMASRLTDPSSPIAAVLQILLNKLWDAARANGGEPRYTRELYGSLSDRDNPLLGFYSEQLEKVFNSDSAGRYRDGVELDLLLEHTTELGTSRRRTLEELRECYPHVPGIERLIQSNKDTYLLTDPAAASDGGPAATALAHDTLAPLIRRDFTLSLTDGARARRVLENRAQEWERTEGKVSDPLNKIELRVVAKGIPQMRKLTASETELLRVSREKLRRYQRKMMIWISAAAVVVIVAFALILTYFSEATTVRQLMTRSTGEVDRAGELLGLLQSMQAVTDTKQLRLLAAYPSASLKSGVRGNLREALNRTMEVGRYPLNALGLSLGVCPVALDTNGHLRLQINGSNTATYDGALIPSSWSTANALIQCDPASGRIVQAASNPPGQGIQTLQPVNTWKSGIASTLDISSMGHGEDQSLTALGISADGNKIAVGASGATDALRIFDLHTGASMPVSPVTGRINALAFSADGTMLGAATDNGWTVWNLTPAGAQQRISEPVGAAQIQFGASAGGSFALIMQATGKSCDVAFTYLSAPQKAEKDKNAETDAEPSKKKKKRREEQQVSGDAPAAGTRRSDGLGYGCSPTQAPRTMAISADGKLVAVGLADGGVDVWDLIHLKDAGKTKHIHAGSTAVQALAFSPDSNLLSTASEINSGVNTDQSHAVRVWDLKAGNRKQYTDKDRLEDLFKAACTRVHTYLEDMGGQPNPFKDEQLNFDSIQSACGAKSEKKAAAK